VTEQPSSPSPEQQLAFLTKLQRLYAEGDFTATYKFALLIALADLAVELGDDSGAELPIRLQQIAGRFIQLYWRSAAPYSHAEPGEAPGVLVQNLGRQAAVVGLIAEFRDRVRVPSPQAAQLHPDYQALRSCVAQVVSAQPLTYLQNFGGNTDPFLYERRGAGLVVLKPGVAFCFRRFQPLVQQLSRTSWIAHVRANQQNWPILGDSDDLEQFLFETPRQSLLALGRRLQAIDGGTCFYCQQPMTSCDVDHFVPFSQYPRDIAHNFVLAHPTCNRSKSDALAAKVHLERWLARLITHSARISEIGLDVGVVADDAVCQSVARWSYSSAVAAGSRAWIAARSFEPVDSSYLDRLW
jgi:5-methylcytosine-specific restriction endonuclease McrA